MDHVRQSPDPATDVNGAVVESRVHDVQTHDLTDEGEEDVEHVNQDAMDAMLLDWIREHKLTFIRDVLLQQEISLREISALNHTQRRYCVITADDHAHICTEEYPYFSCIDISKYPFVSTILHRDQIRFPCHLIHRQFVDSLQIENPIFERRLQGAVEKLEGPHEHIAPAAPPISPTEMIEERSRFVEHGIKRMTESMQMLQLQLANHQSKVEAVYSEVMERATKYREIAISEISKVYQSQLSILNVKLNQFMAMQQKIIQVLTVRFCYQSIGAIPRGIPCVSLETPSVFCLCCTILALLEGNIH